MLSELFGAGKEKIGSVFKKRLASTSLKGKSGTIYNKQNGTENSQHVPQPQEQQHEKQLDTVSAVDKLAEAKALAAQILTVDISDINIAERPEIDTTTDVFNPTNYDGSKTEFRGRDLSAKNDMSQLTQMWRNLPSK